MNYNYLSYFDFLNEEQSIRQVYQHEKKLDLYEDFPILYKKIFFYYYGKKVMTYTMVKKSPFRFPTERYLNIVKRGYRDCKLDKKHLIKALKP